jgi:hypothetical protein
MKKSNNHVQRHKEKALPSAYSKQKVHRPPVRHSALFLIDGASGFSCGLLTKIIRKKSDRNVTGKQADSLTRRGRKRSLNRRILRNTTLNILILVVICWPAAG